MLLLRPSNARPLPRTHAAQNLDLTNNSLSGTIPSSVGALTALTTLDLTGNADIALSVGKSLDLKVVYQVVYFLNTSCHH